MGAGSHVTITPDAWELTTQGPMAPPPPGHETRGTHQPCPPAYMGPEGPLLLKYDGLHWRPVKNVFT